MFSRYKIPWYFYVVEIWDKTIFSKFDIRQGYQLSQGKNVISYRYFISMFVNSYSYKC
jgi:hypothetical protein